MPYVLFPLLYLLFVCDDSYNPLLGIDLEEALVPIGWLVHRFTIFFNILATVLFGVGRDFQWSSLKGRLVWEIALSWDWEIALNWDLKV